jgi:hypothetical protein
MSCLPVKVRRNSKGMPQRVQPRPSNASQVHIYVCMDGCIDVCVCVCVCTYVYTYILCLSLSLSLSHTHTHTHTPTHTHTHTHRLIVSVYPHTWTISQVRGYLRECGRVLEGVRSRGGSSDDGRARAVTGSALKFLRSVDLEALGINATSRAAISNRIQQR